MRLPIGACSSTRPPASLSLTKSADPTIYSYPGQAIVYTFLAQNTGNVTLSGPFVITDDKLGTITCQSGATPPLAPNASISCTASYTIGVSDLNGTNDGSITNQATAAGVFGNATVTSNQAQATVNQLAPTARITPTNTTCQQFRDGTNGNLLDELYNAKANTIKSIAPGVFFYYSKITAPASSFTIQVGQSNTSGALDWGPIRIQDLGQVIVWTADCTKQTATATYSGTTEAVTINVTGATPGAFYYVSVKYDPGSLVGKSAAGKPTVPYTFVTSIDGTQVLTSWDSVNVKPK